MMRRDCLWLLPVAVVVTASWFAACEGPAPEGNASRGNPSASGGMGGSGINLTPGSSGPLTSASAGQWGQSGSPPTKTDNCGSQKRIVRTSADVLLVLDKSASMNDGTKNATTGTSSTRYKDVVAALNQVLPKTDATINWGLELFPHEPGGGCTPGEVDVTIKPSNASAVIAAYDPKVVTPGGLTPVTASLANAVKSLVTLDDGNPKYIVLATDGEPNCNTGFGSAGDNAAAAVRAAQDAGIPVFVISLSSEGSPETLNKMALAGGKPLDDPKTKYYKAETTDEMVAVMNAIHKEVATCQFKLPSPPPVPDNVLVVYDDGRQVAASSKTWGYADASNTSIIVYGDDCQKVMSGTYRSVEMLYGCPASCGANKNETARNMGDVLLVLDRSASMNDGTTGTRTATSGTRYSDVVAALNQVLPQTDAAINWGLELFPGPEGGCTPGTVDVSIKPNNARAVSAVYDPRLITPSGLTPTTPSLQNATQALQSLNDGNPKYIVLATDGEPNCGNEPKDAVAAIGAAKDAGIPVFVISLSKEGSPDTLNKMAVAGGKPLDDANDPKTRYYKAETSAQLVTVMNAIRKEIATCVFTLSSAPPVPDNVLVIFDDGHRALPGSTTWEYSNAEHTSITVVGDDCTKLRDGTYQKVQILFGCPNDSRLIP